MWKCSSFWRHDDEKGNTRKNNDFVFLLWMKKKKMNFFFHSKTWSAQWRWKFFCFLFLWIKKILWKEFWIILSEDLFRCFVGSKMVAKLLSWTDIAKLNQNSNFRNLSSSPHIFPRSFHNSGHHSHKNPTAVFIHAKKVLKWDFPSKDKTNF